MDASVAAPAAPAQPAAPAPVTVSATRAAANRNDFAAFEQAEQAARVGKPLPAVSTSEAAPAPPEKPVESKPADAAAAPPTLSKRQQEINERAQRAADAATAQLREENARLRAQLDTLAPRQPAQPTAPAQPDKKDPEWKRYAGMPDAPKLADFESVEEHTAAMALFIADKRYEDRAAAERTSRSQSERDAYTQRKVGEFDTRVESLAQADPAIVETIAPVAAQLGSWAAQGGPAKFLADLVMDSPAGPQVLKHFASTPDGLRAFLQVPESLKGRPLDALVQGHMRHLQREFDKLEAQYTTPPAAPAATAAPATPPPSPVSAAPPPAPTLSRPSATADPQKAAFARGDFAEWDRIETEKERARRSA